MKFVTGRELRLDPQYIQRRIHAERALKEIRDEAAERGLDRLTPQEIDRIIKETRRARKRHNKK